MFCSEISDDYLICLYRENNDDAKKELCDRYTNFIYGIIVGVQKIWGYYLDFEECFQEGFLSFLKCIDRYDNEKGSFYFFVKTTIERKLLYRLDKERQESNYVPLDKFIYKDGDETLVDYVSEDKGEQEYDCSIYDKATSRMDEICRKIVELRIDGYSYSEIAQILGVNKQSVYRQVVKIKNIIKDVIEKID